MSNERNEKREEPDKRPYRAPSLIVYGALHELTRNGTATTNENNGQGRCGSAFAKSGKPSC